MAVGSTETLRIAKQAQGNPKRERLVTVSWSRAIRRLFLESSVLVGGQRRAGPRIALHPPGGRQCCITKLSTYLHALDTTLVGMSSTGLDRTNLAVIRFGSRGTTVANPFRMGARGPRGQVSSWMLSGRAARSAIGNGYASPRWRRQGGAGMLHLSEEEQMDN
ncbi:hypothetical protein LZ32DRAFT_225549 [Colletotrichum eremochloae]|nr:hypothetical protein LZ32DRAFT_225549 [Colletotrichum eremochloae]